MFGTALTLLGDNRPVMNVRRCPSSSTVGFQGCQAFFQCRVRVGTIGPHFVEYSCSSTTPDSYYTLLWAFNFVSQSEHEMRDFSFRPFRQVSAITHVV
jgi:hypothetical protein